MIRDQFLSALQELADLQRESDRLRLATAARWAFEDVVARHDGIGREGIAPEDVAVVREEAAAYLSGRKPVPPPVTSAELIAHAHRRIEVLGRLAAAGIDSAALGVTEAEAELATLPYVDRDAGDESGRPTPLYPVLAPDAAPDTEPASDSDATSLL